MDPNEALPREDIVSWIEEFSYIYSSDLFDFDDIQVSGDNKCPSWKGPPKDDVVGVNQVGFKSMRHSANV